MKLISCHIENFGKLQSFDYLFDNEKSIIHEDNGWGKSTLATFIRVMFYGFIGENKRTIIDNERKKFRPWQMGVYGGNIIFSVNGKEYRMERRFGEKKSGTDEFALYDNTTNLMSNDYSANIGEELFGIDIESFMRTVFIAQQDCSTEVTSNINAKIGNVSDQTADMGNYNEVKNTLKKEMDKLTPDRATGFLNKTEDKISELREKVRNKDNYIISITELSKRLQEQVEQKIKKQEELQNVQKELERVSALKDSQVGAEKYKELCEQETKAKNKFLEEKVFFPYNIPAKKDVESAIAKCDEYEDMQQTVKNFSLSDDEKKRLAKYEDSFSAGVPDESLLNQAEESIDKLSELEAERDSSQLSDPERRKLDDAEKLFEKYKPSLEEIDNLANKWSVRISKKEALSAKKANAELVKNASEANKNFRNSNKSIGLAFLVIGIIVALGGVIAILASKGVAIGAVISVIGVITAIIGALLSFGKDKEKTEDQENTVFDQMLDEIAKDEAFIKEVEQDCKGVLDKLGIKYSELDVQSELSRIRGVVKDYDDLLERNQKGNSSEREAEIKALVEYITVFFKEYSIDLGSNDYKKALYQLRNNAADYSQIKKKQESMQKALHNGEAIGEEIKVFLSGLGFDAETDLKKQLSTINEKCISLEYIGNELEEKTKRKEDFEKTHDVKKYKDVSASTESVSLEELNKSFNELKDKIDSISELKDNFSEQIDEVSQKLEALENDESELANLQEEYDAAMKKYEIIGKTRDYLEKAKLNFSRKYMDDIKDSFEKYHNMISDSDEKYELDANLNIKLKEKGSVHDIDHLSEGYKDLVGLCRRMAMVDAMYDFEKPFLIFDDPFVNLDESRLAGAMRFLDNLAKDYQIVYFSCHQSRC